MNIKNIFLFLFSLGLLQFAVYTIQDKTVIEEIEMEEFEKIIPKLTENEKRFENFFINLDKEMILLKNTAYFRSFVQKNIYKVEIEELFLQILKKVPELNQLRYIDQDGNEIIRAQRKNSSTFLMPDNQLQNKRHRYYFKNIMESNDNKMWLSRIDANMENGIVDFPEQRTLRIGISVLVDNAKMGILIANIKMDSFTIEDGAFLEGFRASVNKNIYIAF